MEFILSVSSKIVIFSSFLFPTFTHIIFFFLKLGIVKELKYYANSGAFYFFYHLKNNAQI